jgi:hypothetical protein
LAWVALLGCHPLQGSIEALYEREFRDAWCSYLLADLLVGAPAPSSSSPLAARGSSSSGGGAPTAADAASRPPAQREEAEASPPGDGASSLSLRDVRSRCLQSLEQCCDSLLRRGEDSPPGTAEDPLSVYLGGGPGGQQPAAWERQARRRLPSCTPRQLHAERERIRAANAALPNALLQAWQHRRGGRRQTDDDAEEALRCFPCLVSCHGSIQDLSRTRAYTKTGHVFRTCILVIAWCGVVTPHPSHEDVRGPDKLIGKCGSAKAPGRLQRA